MSDAVSSGLGGFTGVLLAIGTIYAAINHRRIRATCCGRKIEVELHIARVKPEEDDLEKGSTQKSAAPAPDS